MENFFKFMLIGFCISLFVVMVSKSCTDTNDEPEMDKETYEMYKKAIKNSREQGYDNDYNAEKKRAWKENYNRK